MKNIYQQESKTTKRTQRSKHEEEEFKDSKTPFTELENRLCERLALKPHEYLMIKEILVRESISQGVLARDSLNNIFDPKKIEKVKLNEVFDFLVSNDLVLEK